MTIRLDGQTVGPTQHLRPPAPSSALQRLRFVLSTEVQTTVDAMRVCQALMQPENKTQVAGGGVLTTPNEISTYGLRRLARVHARLEQSLDRYFTPAKKPRTNGKRPNKARKGR